MHATPSSTASAADALARVRSRRLRQLREKLYACLAALVIAILLITLTGCGGGGDDEAAAAHPQPVDLYALYTPGDTKDGARIRLGQGCPADIATFVGPIPAWCATEPAEQPGGAQAEGALQ